jgi:hypothetical protein
MTRPAPWSAQSDVLECKRHVDEGCYANTA